MLPWGRLLSPKDNSGRESRTLFFISITVLIIWILMVTCGVCFVIQKPVISVTDLATAMVALGGVIMSLLGIWLGREWIKKQ